MINIAWKVEKIECLQNSLGVDKLVQKVWYSVQGTETVDGITYEGHTEGFASITPTGDDLVSFNSLDEETVISWVWANGVDKVLAEDQVVRQIESKKAPDTIITEFPWN